MKANALNSGISFARFVAALVISKLGGGGRP